MFDKSILSLGFAVAVIVAATSLPAKATPVGAVVAAGVAGTVLGVGLASAARADGRYVEAAPVWDYGAPAYVRPYPVSAGPGRHRVCGWQDRYDRYERYVGSRRICWVEAY